MPILLAALIKISPAGDYLQLATFYMTPEKILQNRYKILHCLGQGGMGAVFEAEDRRLSSTVAIKESFVFEEGPESIRRAFEREARLLANLNHPNLPRVIDYFTEHEKQYLVMDFIPGGDLEAQLKSSGRPFEIERVLAWTFDLLDALDYLHGREPQILHRDIKPANLKTNAQGKIILLDFGLAKGLAGLMTARHDTRSILGFSKNYSSPEQIQDGGTTHLSDLYSLAATIYRLLTGIRPADAGERVHALITGQPDPLVSLEKLNSSIPAGAAKAITRALELNPRERPGSAAEMKKLFTAKLQSAASSIKSEQLKRGEIYEDNAAEKATVISRSAEANLHLSFMTETTIAERGGMLEKALRSCCASRRVSTGSLQKELGIGFENADALINAMVDYGWAAQKQNARFFYLTNAAFETVALWDAEDEIKEQKEKEVLLSDSDDLPGKRDPLFEESLRCITSSKSASTSLLQRHLRIGYGRAAAILDAMVREGYIGEMNGGKRARPILEKAYNVVGRMSQPDGKKTLKPNSLIEEGGETPTVIKNNLFNYQFESAPFSSSYVEPPAFQPFSASGSSSKRSLTTGAAHRAATVQSPKISGRKTVILLAAVTAIVAIVLIAINTIDK